MRLTATLIARDEQRHLPGCLESLRGVADEIVVVDTGSTDSTSEIARRFGARVFDHTWTSDFASARNAALSHARGEWILYIDADERLSIGESSSVPALLADRTVVCYTVRFRPREGFTRYHEYRLFRNDPRLRFSGVFHETMLAGILQVEREDGLRIASSDLAIDHIGYDGDLTRKHERNLPMLRARLQQDPGQMYCWDHLGRTLEAMGQHEQAREAWRTAIGIVRSRGVVDALDGMPYADLLRHLSPEDEGFAALLEEALDRFPDDYLLHWIQGRALMSAGRFDDARPWFEGLTQVDPDLLCHRRVGYDARIFRVLS